MTASQSLIPAVSFLPNLTAPAFVVPGSVVPGSGSSASQTAALALAQLPAPGSLPPGTGAVIGDSSIAYSGSAIGSIAIGGGSNICRVLSTPSGWIIG